MKATTSPRPARPRPPRSRRRVAVMTWITNKPRATVTGDGRHDAHIQLEARAAQMDCGRGRGLGP